MRDWYIWIGILGLIIVFDVALWLWLRMKTSEPAEQRKGRELDMRPRAIEGLRQYPLVVALVALNVVTIGAVYLGISGDIASLSGKVDQNQTDTKAQISELKAAVDKIGLSQIKLGEDVEGRLAELSGKVDTLHLASDVTALNNRLATLTEQVRTQTVSANSSQEALKSLVQGIQRELGPAKESVSNLKLKVKEMRAMPNLNGLAGILDARLLEIDQRIKVVEDLIERSRK